jgi:hypothetical protein
MVLLTKACPLDETSNGSPTVCAEVSFELSDIASFHIKPPVLVSFEFLCLAVASRY